MTFDHLFLTYFPVFSLSFEVANNATAVAAIYCLFHKESLFFYLTLNVCIKSYIHFDPYHDGVTARCGTQLLYSECENLNGISFPVVFLVGYYLKLIFWPFLLEAMAQANDATKASFS